MNFLSLKNETIKTIQKREIQWNKNLCKTKIVEIDVGTSDEKFAGS